MRPDPITPLVRQSAEMPVDDVPPAAIAKARVLLLDTVGCVLAGSSAEAAGELREAVAFWGGREQATILGFGERTSAPWAAFVNSAVGHARDYDDTHDTAVNHASVTVIPAALAMAEARSRSEDGPAWLPRGPVSGREFLAAVAVGLEVCNRMGLAFIDNLHAGWLPTTLWGPFASAAACGRLLGLDVERMGHAFGFAYSQIHGNRQALVDGALAKRIQPGWSASAGVQAACLAASGLTAARGIVSGSCGLATLYTGGRFDPAPLAGLGGFEETLNISIKPYPSCRCTQPVIDAALEICGRWGVSAEDIADGVIRLTTCAMTQIGAPFRLRGNPTVDAQFSGPYTAALAFLHGRPGLRDFEAETVRERGDVVELAGRFRAEEFEPDSSSLVPAEVEVTLRSGETRRVRAEAAKGSPAKPMSEAELAAKFEDCLANSAWRLPADTAGRLRETILRVEGLPDVAALADGLRF